MGGFGSGRQPHSFNRTTNRHLSIDIRIWAKDGILTPGPAFVWQWTLRGKRVGSILVEIIEDKLVIHPLFMSKHREPIKTQILGLDWTNCNLGGRRPWFLCPQPGCNTRVALLYWKGSFGCIKCFNLHYESENESKTDRIARRAGWIRKKLNWSPGILNPTGGKPKGMRWQTYYRLASEHSRLADIALTSLVKRLPYSTNEYPNFANTRQFNIQHIRDKTS